jgi:hypothetical protein
MFGLSTLRTAYKLKDLDNSSANDIGILAAVGLTVWAYIWFIFNI